MLFTSMWIFAFAGSIYAGRPDAGNIYQPNPSMNEAELNDEKRLRDAVEGLLLLKGDKRNKRLNKQELSILSQTVKERGKARRRESIFGTVGSRLNNFEFEIVCGFRIDQETCLSYLLEVQADLESDGYVPTVARSEGSMFVGQRVAELLHIPREVHDAIFALVSADRNIPPQLVTRELRSTLKNDFRTLITNRRVNLWRAYCVHIVLAGIESACAPCSEGMCLSSSQRSLFLADLVFRVGRLRAKRSTH